MYETAPEGSNASLPSLMNLNLELLNLNGAKIELRLRLLKTRKSRVSKSSSPEEGRQRTHP